MKVLIVGQAPSRTSDPSEPLSGKSGARLATLCGLTLPEFLDRFDRVNLLPGWQGKAGKGDVFLRVPEARAAVEQLRATFSGRRAVVLGAINATAFGLDWPKLSFRPHWGGSFAWCPHPSGINPQWNDPCFALLAGQFWRDVASGLLPGSSQPPRAS